MVFPSVFTPGYDAHAPVVKADLVDVAAVEKQAARRHSQVASGRAYAAHGA